jgi:hypothetical protein
MHRPREGSLKPAFKSIVQPMGEETKINDAFNDLEAIIR